MAAWAAAWAEWAAWADTTCKKVVTTFCRSPALKLKKASESFSGAFLFLGFQEGVEVLFKTLNPSGPGWPRAWEGSAQDVHAFSKNTYTT